MLVAWNCYEYGHVTLREIIFPSSYRSAVSSFVSLSEVFVMHLNAKHLKIRNVVMHIHS